MKTGFALYLQQLGCVLARFTAVLLAMAFVGACIAAGVFVAIEYLLPPAL
jgi:hypothetical protein